MALVPKRLIAVFSIPVLHRAAYHFRRITGGLDGSFYRRVGLIALVILLVASAVVTVTERNEDEHEWNTVREFFGQFLLSVHWSVTTVMAAGDSSYVATPIGILVSWLLVLFGVAIVAALTGALVGFLIDFLLKEGQGMGASGYRDHIVVCGWNSTARELIAELSTDEYTTKIVVVAEGDKNPAGDGVYFISGDITTAERPGPGRDRGRDGGGGLPGGRLQRGGHEVDPVRDGDRVARARRCGPSSRSTTRRTSSTSSVRTPTRSWSAPSSCRG